MLVVEDKGSLLSHVGSKGWGKFTFPQLVVEGEGKFTLQLLVVEGKEVTYPTVGSRGWGKFSVPLLVVGCEGSLLSHSW